MKIMFKTSFCRDNFHRFELYNRTPKKFISSREGHRHDRRMTGRSHSLPTQRIQGLSTWRIDFLPASLISPFPFASTCSGSFSMHQVFLLIQITTWSSFHFRHSTSTTSSPLPSFVPRLLPTFPSLLSPSSLPICVSTFLPPCTAVSSEQSALLPRITRIACNRIPCLTPRSISAVVKSCVSPVS